ncbi:MAG: amino acid permease, partial [Parvularcula sp.]|nr:amino acid permease [Parvularcula sp.]
LAYVLAALVAVFTALSFAEVGSRIPTAAGAIDYVEQGFGNRRFGTIVGWLLVIANIVSGATITTGFVSYLSSFIEVPGWAATTGLILLMGGIAIAGMKESTLFMTITTVIGILTLGVILFLTRDAVMAAPGKMMGEFSGAGSASFTGLFAGAFLAIYSFIGFGDMAQTAEETKDVQKTLPRTIIIAMIVVFTLYVVVAMSLVGQDDMNEIASAKAPLVKAIEGKGIPTLPVAIASLFVIVNGGLTQIIAASRLLLDLGRDDRMGAPSRLGRVNETTNTPVIATVLTLAIVLALALFVPLKNLAAGTSFAILLVFSAVNAALFAMKRKDQPENVPNMPKFVPILGVIFCLLAIAGQLWSWFAG